jgi:hypothetical protein
MNSIFIIVFSNAVVRGPKKTTMHRFIGSVPSTALHCPILRCTALSYFLSPFQSLIISLNKTIIYIPDMIFLRNYVYALQSKLFEVES